MTLLAETEVEMITLDLPRLPLTALSLEKTIYTVVGRSCESEAQFSYHVVSTIEEVLTINKGKLIIKKFHISQESL